MSDAYKAKQAALTAEHIAKQDVIITTALIPGRKAPVLVSEEMVKPMKPGSVIIDLAASRAAIARCPSRKDRDDGTASQSSATSICPARLAVDVLRRSTQGTCSRS